MLGCFNHLLFTKLLYCSLKIDWKFKITHTESLEVKYEHLLLSKNTFEHYLIYLGEYSIVYNITQSWEEHTTAGL